jgi:ABC-type nitrate/sulfonate/bicarbonate transport system permease component
LAGYLESVFLAIPIGFIIGLWPFFRGSFQRGVDAIRFVPLTAVTGLFIVWFGLGTEMKVHFLAFGIFIYLLPVVVQRIDEVQNVYLKTVYTLGATDWQMIRTVYIPSVISRLSDDIRVLTAISWTYIIIAEAKGNQGGIGALLWRVGERQGRVDKVFAILLLIIFIGILQDKLFTYLDKEFFPYKYQTKDKYQRKETEFTNILSSIWEYAVNAMLWIFIIGYVILLVNEFIPIFNSPVLTTLFGDTQWAVTMVVLAVLGYKCFKLYKRFAVKRGTPVPAS